MGSQRVRHDWATDLIWSVPVSTISGIFVRGPSTIGICLMISHDCTGVTVVGRKTTEETALLITSHPECMPSTWPTWMMLTSVTWYKCVCQVSHCTGTIFLFLFTLSSAGGSSYAQPIHKERELRFPPWGCTSTYLDSVLMVKNKLRFRSSIYRTSEIAMGMIPVLRNTVWKYWPRQHGQMMHMLRFVVRLLSRVQLFETPWTAAHQAHLVFTISWSLLKFMSIESMMLSNHLILCDPFLLLPSVLPSIRVFSNVSSSHQLAKVLELQLEHQSFQWIFRTDFL